MIAQIFKPTAELVIPIGIPTTEANPDIDAEPLLAETKITKFSNKFQACHIYR